MRACINLIRQSENHENQSDGTMIHKSDNCTQVLRPNS